MIPYFNNRVVSIIVTIALLTGTLYFLPAKAVNDHALAIIGAIMLIFFNVRIGLAYVRPRGE